MIKNDFILQKKWNKKIYLYEKNVRWRIFIQINSIRQKINVDEKITKKFSTISMRLIHIELTQFYEVELSTISKIFIYFDDFWKFTITIFFSRIISKSSASKKLLWTLRNHSKWQTKRVTHWHFRNLRESRSNIKIYD